jgi:hypothetical protein
MGQFEKQRACPRCEANSVSSDMPSRYARNFSPVHYINTVVQEHQCFFLAKFRTLAMKKKTLGNPTKGFLGDFLKGNRHILRKKTRGRQI